MGTPTSIELRELTGQKNRLGLYGRALPYRPLAFSGTMRVETTWYPGNPIATMQMLGPQEDATTINGMWKDRFIKSMTDAIGPIPPMPVLSRAGSAYYNGGLVEDVYQLVRIVDGFRRRGQLIEFLWDEFKRHGVMTKFRHTWLRREDVEWEMEFQWISQGDPIVPVAFGFDLAILDAVNQMSAWLNSLIAAVQAVFSLVNSVLNAVNNLVDQITQAVGALIDLAKQAVNVVLSPLEIARQVRAAYQTIKDKCRDLEDTAKALPAKVTRISDDIKGVSQDEALQVAAWQQQIAFVSRGMAATAARQQQEIDARTNSQPQVAVVTGREAQNLRDLSTRHYGTPNEWKRIREYNRLKGSRLRAGKQVYIPRLQAPSDRWRASNAR